MRLVGHAALRPRDPTGPDDGRGLVRVTVWDDSPMPDTTGEPATGAPGAPDLTDADRAALEVLTAGTAQVLPAGSLATLLVRARAEGRPLRVKLGIDPS